MYRFSALSIRHVVSARLWVYSLWAICALSGSTLAQDFKTVRDGIEHAALVREFSGRPVSINMLRLDLRKVRIDVQRAGASVLGTERTSSIAARHNAAAAINAGFFRLDTSPFLGDPVGLFMIDGDPLSEAVNDRTQLIINNGPSRTDVFFGRSRLSVSFRIGSETFTIDGINRERKADDLVMYTPEFGRTTLAGDDDIELVIVKGNIYSISHGVGNSVIPKNGYVISASGAKRDALKSFAQKDSVTLIKEWTELPRAFLKDRTKLDVVTGVPQLIKNGRIDIAWEQEKANKASFVDARHPRTAVAILKDGKFLMLTADGRSDTSAGLDLHDLAAYLLELGAVDALNLDGGGSTTMYLNGKVVNRPSDASGERKVSDALVVTPRRTPRRR